MSQTNQSNPINASAAVLWASAFVIGALIIIQAGRLPGNAAQADVADRGNYTLLTANSGRGPDVQPDQVLCVIDSREQMLLVYDIEDSRKQLIMIRDGYNLDEQFQRARQ